MTMTLNFSTQGTKIRQFVLPFVTISFCGRHLAFSWVKLETYPIITTPIGWLWARSIQESMVIELKLVWKSSVRTSRRGACSRISFKYFRSAASPIRTCTALVERQNNMSTELQSCQFSNYRIKSHFLTSNPSWPPKFALIHVNVRVSCSNNNAMAIDIKAMAYKNNLLVYLSKFHKAFSLLVRRYFFLSCQRYTCELDLKVWDPRDV